MMSSGAVPSAKATSRSEIDVLLVAVDDALGETLPHLHALVVAL